MFWKRKPEPRELSYGSPWVERARTIEYDELGADRVVEHAYDVEKEGLYEPAVGTDLLYAVEVADSSGSQIVYTDVYPIISVREL